MRFNIRLLNSWLAISLGSLVMASVAPALTQVPPPPKITQPSNTTTRFEGTVK
ncbi:MAG: hypothetical protein ACHBN1_18690 [Heteroscytonema crispum UTEX LB 1556]